MKVIVLAAMIFIVSLGQDGQGALAIQPCQNPSSVQKYNTFVHNHILAVGFNRKSLQAWEWYLVNMGLCGRQKVQSFIDADVGQVDQICRGGGRQVQGATGSKGNLCISNSVLDVYDVYSTMSGGHCKVSTVLHLPINVVVACDNVVNICRPVHYEEYKSQKPGSVVCI